MPARRGRGWTWLIAALGVFVLLIGAGGFAVYQYLSGYYIGTGTTAADNKLVVAYTGKPDEVLGQKFFKKAPQDKQPTSPILVDDLDTAEQMAVRGKITVSGPLDKALRRVQDSVCVYQIHPGGKGNTEVVVAPDASQTARTLTCPPVPAAATKVDQLPEPDKTQVVKGLHLARTAATAKIAELVGKASKNCAAHRDQPACKAAP
jgi:hypothetical protein